MLVFSNERTDLETGQDLGLGGSWGSLGDGSWAGEVLDLPKEAVGWQPSGVSVSHGRRRPELASFGRLCPFDALCLARSVQSTLHLSQAGTQTSA